MFMLDLLAVAAQVPPSSISQSPPSSINPEAMINAAVAAKAAEGAAWQASVMAGITLVALLIIGLIMVVMVVVSLRLKERALTMFTKFDQLERNTDGMRNALIDATRKLALIEGNIAGRAEQTEERKIETEKAEKA